MSDEKTPEGFLSFLHAKGHISWEGAQRAQSAHGQTRQPIDMIIRELGLLPENTIACELANFLQIRYRGAFNHTDEQPLLEQLGLTFAADHAVFPLTENDDVFLIVADPFDTATLELISFFFERNLVLEVAVRSSIDHAITVISNRLSKMDTVHSATNDPLENDLERLKDIAREAPVIKFVSRLIQKAVDEHTTDIHLEPQADSARVRFRRDGLLKSTETLALSLYVGVISRLKILAHLNIAERRLPQDGRLRLPIRGQDIDFRLSIMPTVHGETAVLRILDKETVKLDMRALGYDATALETITALTRRSHGMILITGPTGSGKTTTLYSILTELNQPDVKIFTVEDPVEYRIPGITQLQIDPKIGLTFASALRSVLRQDPDIILVGEIRDRETAQIATQAALTGHLVLSTLHTNSAVGAFNRLRDMGVESFFLEATIRGVIGQRLLRRSCRQCQGQSTTPSCQVCEGRGFKGRQATFEILTLSDPLRQAIVRGAGEIELETLAVAAGMIPLRDHASLLAASGLTTLTEVHRVIELEGR